MSRPRVAPETPVTHDQACVLQHDGNLVSGRRQPLGRAVQGVGPRPSRSSPTGQPALTLKRPPWLDVVGTRRPRGGPMWAAATPPRHHGAMRRHVMPTAGSPLHSGLVGELERARPTAVSRRGSSPERRTRRRRRTRSPRRRSPRRAPRPQLRRPSLRRPARGPRRASWPLRPASGTEVNRADRRTRGPASRRSSAAVRVVR